MASVFQLYDDPYARTVKKGFCIDYIPPRLNSSRPVSPLRRTFILDAELLRRLRRDSAGSAGLRPLARACRFKISVRLTTPTSLPDRRAPGTADAGTEGVRVGVRPADDEWACEAAGWGSVGR